MKKISIIGMLVFIALPLLARAQSGIGQRMSGRILLQVESKGEAWYVRPDTGARVYLGRPADAFAVMRTLGVGITNAHLAKIPLGIVTPELTAGKTAIEKSGAEAVDAVIECKKRYLDRGDSEGYTTCSVKTMSKLIGFDVEKDTDKDGYTDATEILNNYNPYGPGKMPIDEVFTKKNLGRIFLQVEEKGEAWYVDPVRKRRYFLGRPADAFTIMRGFGLGISNADLNTIGIESAVIIGHSDTPVAEPSDNSVAKENVVKEPIAKDTAVKDTAVKENVVKETAAKEIPNEEKSPFVVLGQGVYEGRLRPAQAHITTDEQLKAFWKSVGGTQVSESPNVDFSKDRVILVMAERGAMSMKIDSIRNNGQIEISSLRAGDSCTGPFMSQPFVFVKYPQDVTVTVSRLSAPRSDSKECPTALPKVQLYYTTDYGATLTLPDIVSSFSVQTQKDAGDPDKIATIIFSQRSDVTGKNSIAFKVSVVPVERWSYLQKSGGFSSNDGTKNQSERFFSEIGTTSSYAFVRLDESSKGAPEDISDYSGSKIELMKE